VQITKTLDEIELKKIELKKEKVKMQDQRNELNKAIRQTARFESLSDYINQAFINLKDKDFVFKPIEFKKYENNGNDLLVCLNDLHAGIVVKNFWNEFDFNELKNRMNLYLSKILEKKDLHKSYGLHVFIGGDNISGLIHNSLRSESTANVIDQVIMVTELISNFIYELSKNFAFVRIISVSGNHSRLFSNKSDAVKGERLDNITPWYLKAKLQNVQNVYFIDNAIDESIGVLDIKGKLYYFVHGEYDTPAKVIQNLTMMLGSKPYAVAMCHRHHFAIDTQHDSKVIMSGSMLGTDSYAIENRLSGKASQTVCVCTNDGIDGFYDIILN